MIRVVVNIKNYYPLFRVRSWNNCVRCVSFYILMGELCSQALAAEFTNGSLIFIQVAMPLKISVVREYQYNIVAPVMATRVTCPIVNFTEYVPGICIESLIISWLFHSQYDEILIDSHYKMFYDQHIFGFRFEIRSIWSSSNNDAIVAFEKTENVEMWSFRPVLGVINIACHLLLLLGLTHWYPIIWPVQLMCTQ